MKDFIPFRSRRFASSLRSLAASTFTHFRVGDFLEEGPIDSPLPPKQQARASLYDRQSSQVIQETSSSWSRVWSSHWAEGLDALPFNESDIALIGFVLDAKAHLSSDKTGIYSEFVVQVEEVLQNNAKESLNLSRMISLERFGGAVRFPSGATVRYEVTGVLRQNLILDNSVDFLTSGFTLLV